MSNSLYKKNNWLFFPNSIISDLEVTDCNDTVDGICYENIDLDECLEICQNDSDCDAGYFISNGNFSICAPIKTSVHPELNPAIRLQHKKEQPTLENMDVVTFINTKKYPFPPNTANAVLYEDLFILENIKSKKQIQLPTLDSSNVSLKEGEGINLQLLPYRDTTQKIQSYIPVKYGSSVVVNVPGTNLILSRNNSSLNWLSRVLTVPQIDNTFKIHSVKNSDNSLMYYGDTIYITYQDIYLVVYNDIIDKLELVHSSYSNKLNSQFKLIPRMEVFYCEDNNCKSVSLSQAKIDGVKAQYKKSIVTRNPSCWGICKGGKLEVSSTSQKSNIFVIIGIAGILILMIILWIRKNN